MRHPELNNENIDKFIELMFKVQQEEDRLERQIFDMSLYLETQSEFLESLNLEPKDREVDAAAACGTVACAAGWICISFGYDPGISLSVLAGSFFLALNGHADGVEPKEETEIRLFLWKFMFSAYWADVAPKPVHAAMRAAWLQKVGLAEGIKISNSLYTRPAVWAHICSEFLDDPKYGKYLSLRQAKGI